MGPHVELATPAVTDHPTDTADVRGHRRPWQLSYPPGSVVVLAGVPGAGKTTLLRRLFPRPDTTEVRALDSDQVRLRLAGVLPLLPYPLYRPVVHLVHHLRVWHAVTQRDGPGVVVHDTGTRRWLRQLLTRHARRNGRQAHLLLFDVATEDARSGQVSRARRLSGRRFARHAASWQQMIRAAAERPADLGDYDSVVLFDRAAASRLRHLAFTTRAGVVTICQADLTNLSTSEPQEAVGERSTGRAARQVVP